VIVKAKSSKRLESGVHLLTVRAIDRAIDAASRLPLERTDKASGEVYGALEITLSNHENTGIRERFWLGPKEQWMIDAFANAIGVDNSQGAVDSKSVLGRRLYCIVTKNLMYDNMVPKMDGDRQAWFPKLLMKFFPEGSEPTVQSGELIRHYDSVAGEFTPQEEFFASADEEEISNEECQWL